MIAQGIEALLAARERKELARLVVIGSVDDGKSTLLGRLLWETGALYEDQIAQVRRATRSGNDHSQAATHSRVRILKQQIRRPMGRNHLHLMCNTKLF